LICAVENNEIEIVAYYTIAGNPLRLDGLSNNKQKDIRGGAPIRGKENLVQGILIGQLGRNENSKTYFPSSALFLELFKSIRDANNLLGARIVYLECKNNPKLIEIYKKNGFTQLMDSTGKPVTSRINDQDYLIFVLSMKNLKEILNHNERQN